ncbi:peptide/nickel transport system permease protein [Propionibacterium cyclohexanicum]|uniref:Oligopeptide transport system permease protein OppC n=1 Tax=Propionibacterium cyclohexanicum TaxID=64702 RepID=A0A1H9S3X6_9ACTN|nr:ABC transporter permease [Propionibacterium cyclohexanicum]SER79638.1 peptide/nickel transport system permease protein [Propionibacterium cyclohexanicum]
MSHQPDPPSSNERANFSEHTERTLRADEGTTAVAERDAETLAETELPRRTGRLRLYARRFWRNKPAVVGLGIFLVLVLAALVGGHLSPFTYTEMDFGALAAPPGTQGSVIGPNGALVNGTHWFGTNAGGLDLYAMLMHGLGRSLTIALSVSLLTTLIAAFVGAMAAYLGGWGERAILAVIHFLLILPSFLLLALVANHFSGSWQILIVVLVVFGWMLPARVIWQLSTSIREREFIAAARFMGVRGPAVVMKHIVPNIGSLLVIQFVLGVVSTVMTETGLSFLGFGVKIPDVSLGVLLQDGVNAISSTPWIFWFSAGTLTLLTVSMSLLSDGLRDALDPNSAAGGTA